MKEQWAVQWFPSDGPDQLVEYKTEGAARRRFEDLKETGFNSPILLMRVVPELPPWEIVENSVTL